MSTLGEIEAAMQAVERVRALHKCVVGVWLDGRAYAICTECQESHPCSTIRALDGDNDE